MHTAWILAMGSVLLCTAACAGMAPVDGTETTNAANMTDVDGTEATRRPDDTDAYDADGDDSDEDDGSDGAPTDPELGYGWMTKLEDKSMGKYTLRQIVTNGKVIVRKDGRSCVGCHSWSEYQDRTTFCERVGDFLKMPTAPENDPNPPPNAKPAGLKKILKEWKAAGCPN